MSFGGNWNLRNEIHDKIELSPKLFYIVFSLYFKEEKLAWQWLRKEFGLSMMDCRKIVMILLDEYGNERIKEMLENIEEFQPENAI